MQPNGARLETSRLPTEPSGMERGAASAVVPPSEAELMAERARLQQQNRRSIAIALALVLLVLLFYAATIVRLGGNVMNRAL